MTTLRLSYVVDERVFKATIEAAVQQKQELFKDDLQSPLKEAARRVIYGNFTGKGGVNPRPVGEFRSARSHSYRGWIEGSYGSDRARMATGSRKESDQFAQLKNSFVLEAASRVQPNNPALKGIRAQAQQAMKSGVNPAMSQSPQFASIKGFLASNKHGRALTRPAAKMARKSLGGSARFGVQTGRLADAWYDLGVSLKSERGGLVARFNPAVNRTARTPDAAALTAALARQSGSAWRGLMDHAQLVQALRDAGVIIRE